MHDKTAPRIVMSTALHDQGHSSLKFEFQELLLTNDKKKVKNNWTTSKRILIIDGGTSSSWRPEMNRIGT